MYCVLVGRKTHSHYQISKNMALFVQKMGTKKMGKIRFRQFWAEQKYLLLKTLVDCPLKKRIFFSASLRFPFNRPDEPWRCWRKIILEKIDGYSGLGLKRIRKKSEKEERKKSICTELHFEKMMFYFIYFLPCFLGVTRG